MKVNASLRSAACIACVAFLAVTLLLTSCMSTSGLTRQENVSSVQAVSFRFQPEAELQSVRMFIQKPVGKVVWVNLIDIDGTTLERFSAGKHTQVVDRTYNFENADEGVYKFQIFDGEKTTTRKVTLEREAIKTATRLVIE